MLGKRKVIALCMSRVHDEVNYHFLSELNRNISKQHDCLFVYNTCYDIYMESQGLDGEKKLYDIPSMNIIDAMIICDNKIMDKEALHQFIERVKQHHIPVVVVGEESYNCIQVRFDFKKGFENVVRYVMDHYDPKTVRFFGNRPGCKISLERENVLRAVLREKNIYFDDSMVSYGRFWDTPAEKEMNLLVQQGNIPDAVICANDMMAIAVCNVLQRHGYRVPEDVVVSGFDGIKKMEAIMPFIPTARTSFEALAKLTFEVIYTLMENRPVEKMYLVEPSLVEPLKKEEANDIFSHAEIENEYISEVVNTMDRYLETERMLSGIVAKSQIANNIEDFAMEWYNKGLRPMFCILNKNTVEGKEDPFHFVNKRLFEDGMYMLFDTKEKEFVTPFKVTAQDVHKMLIHMSHLEQPFIFTPLCYLHIPLGCVCHYFSDKSMETYYQIPQVVSALNNAIGGYRNCRYQHHLKKQMEEIYKYDILTGLYNRTGFMKEYEKLVEQNEIVYRKNTVILADLDKLKYINDKFGHEEGDFALRVVAKALMNACPQHALCTRYGGDEMVAYILGECDCDKIVTEIREYIEMINQSDHKPYKISCSVGIFSANKDMQYSFDEMVKKVDRLMYQEKDGKRLVG